MSFNIFVPDADQCVSDYVEFTENSMCWANDVSVAAGSWYRYSSGEKWDFTKKDSVFSLCCAGDYLEVVEPGNPPKRTVYVVV